MIPIIKQLNDSIRFILELITIGLLLAGTLTFRILALKIIFSIVLPLCTVLFWGKYMAPLSPNRLSEVERILVEIILFGGVACLTFFVGHKKIAVAYLLIVTINTLFDHIL
ncbi:hypothetical protein ATZ35_09570 [Enterococcus rotai]|uniref:DUF2568 domain-containing protein n=1 Tax=Enterococcus rotai TaxID=118060 RepID=A0A0U2XB95_9ENTE|nr:YrdB family protein [Enterococcus rotai]ALS37392.1 hypothetical protein ATZ35_09570 [Enterococcus rotai]